MITVDNMHEFVLAFAKIQGIEVKEEGDKWSIRITLPADAINALMSDFIARGIGPTFKLDEDQLFYAKSKSKNISLLIQEGRTYKIENIVPNQEMEKEIAGGDDTIPGHGLVIPMTRPKSGPHYTSKPDYKPEIIGLS